MICGLLWMVSCLVTASILFVIGYRNYKKWKIMDEAPTRMVVDIEPGRVEINGKITSTPGKEMRSPLTGTTCVQYKVEVQEYRSSGKSHYWATIHKNERGGPFLVTDESGKVLVDPKKVKLQSVQTMRSEQGMFNEMNMAAQNYVQQLGIRDKGFFGVFKRTLRVIESVIPVGQDLYVLGDAVEAQLDYTLENDLTVSPYTIKKKGTMILSFESEKKLSGKKKVAWISLYTISGLLVFLGLFGLIVAIIG